MTIEDEVNLLRDIALLAGMVVLETPIRSANSTKSYVRRSLIAKIEVALMAAGYNMNTARSNLKGRRL